MPTWAAVVAVLGLALITVLTRGLFFLTQREIPLPAWLQHGLRYAPLAALAAVVVPEIVLTQGQLIGSLKEARVVAALVAAAFFFWRRSILGTILLGMAVFLPLRLGLGW
jgi:branched-subunit amino acid transport protein